MAYITTLNQGIQLYRPNIFIKWEMTREEIFNLLADYKINKMNENKYSINVVLFEDLNCTLVFTFNEKNKIYKAEIFRNGLFLEESELLNAYRNLNQTLEILAGKPSKVSSIFHAFIKTNKGDLESRWNLEKIIIIHNIWDRFGLEEHLEMIVK